jgi:autotransporter passenger strand-loop-strand repeat protein
VASGAIVGSGGYQFVNYAGSTIGTVVQSGGYMEILATGVASGTTVSGGELTVASGGVVVDTKVVAGAAMIASGAAAVASGGRDVGVTLVSSGTETVYATGVADDTVVSNGGTQIVSSGGSAVGATVSGFGTQNVLSGGTDSYTVVISDGTQQVFGSAAYTSITSGGVGYVQSGGTSISATITSQGQQIIYGGGTASAATVSANGFEVVFSGQTVSTIVGSGGSEQVGAGRASALYADVLSGGYLTVVIRTPSTDTPVEQLRPGDLLVTATGQRRPIIWIGQRQVDCRRHPDPAAVWPVLIAAGAFADGIPARDLLLSPDHAVFADDVLIPIRQLINATSIRQIETPSIRYFHVELSTHDVILAAGLPTESYLDTGNRAAFGNASVAMQRHPDFARPMDYHAQVWEALGYASLLITGPEVAIVRAGLASRVNARKHRSPRRRQA